jgi:hypothetical protein
MPGLGCCATEKKSFDGVLSELVTATINKQKQKYFIQHYGSLTSGFSNGTFLRKTQSNQTYSSQNQTSISWFT